MSDLRIEGDARVLKQLRDLETGAPKVTARALTRTAVGTRVEVSRLIRRQLIIKASAVNRGLTVRKASVRNQCASVEAKNRRGSSLINFKVSPSRPNPKRRPKRGVSVQVKKFGSPKVIRGAFVATSSLNDHTGVFRRTTDARYPLKHLYGPHFSTYLRRGVVRRNAQKYMRERLRREVLSGLRFLMQRTTGKMEALT